jgi:Neurotransmitter-gated ion-channel ligand binding domain
MPKPIYNPSHNGQPCDALMLGGGAERSHKLPISAFLAVACLIMLIPATLRAQEAPNNVPENGFTPPLSQAGSVDVEVGLYITNLVFVDEVDEQFGMSGYLYASWKDPRLAFKAENRAEREKDYQPDQLWIPNLVMANRIAKRDKVGTDIRVRADGTVEYLEAFGVELSTPFALQPFPFDRQELEIVIQPFLDERAVLNLIPDLSHTGVSSENWAGLSEWDILGVTASTERPRIADSAERTPEINFRLELKRHSAFYIWRLGLPLLVIVLVSYCSLWITTPDHFAQLTVAVSAILTMIAFRFVISASLPRIPYLTYLDEFYLACFLFSFLTLVELVLVHRLLDDRRTIAAQRLRRGSRWVYPLLFVLCNLVVAAVFFGI